MNEYASQFTRLEKFAPGVYLTEADRIKRFKRGLAPSLAPLIYPHAYTHLHEAINAATGLERLVPGEGKCREETTRGDRPTKR